MTQQLESRGQEITSLRNSLQDASRWRTEDLRRRREAYTAAIKLAERAFVTDSQPELSLGVQSHSEGETGVGGGGGRANLEGEGELPVDIALPGINGINGVSSPSLIPHLHTATATGVSVLAGAKAAPTADGATTGTGAALAAAAPVREPSAGSSTSGVKRPRELTEPQSAPRSAAAGGPHSAASRSNTGSNTGGDDAISGSVQSVLAGGSPRRVEKSLDFGTLVPSQIVQQRLSVDAGDAAASPGAGAEHGDDGDGDDDVDMHSRSGGESSSPLVGVIGAPTRVVTEGGDGEEEHVSASPAKRPRMSDTESAYPALTSPTPSIVQFPSTATSQQQQQQPHQLASKGSSHAPLPSQASSAAAIEVAVELVVGEDGDENENENEVSGGGVAVEETAHPEGGEAEAEAEVEVVSDSSVLSSPSSSSSSEDASSVVSSIEGADSDPQHNTSKLRKAGEAGVGKAQRRVVYGDAPHALACDTTANAAYLWSWPPQDLAVEMENAATARDMASLLCIKDKCDAMASIRHAADVFPGTSELLVPLGHEVGSSADPTNIGRDHPTKGGSEEGPLTYMKDSKVSRKQMKLVLVEGGAAAQVTNTGMNEVFVVTPGELVWEDGVEGPYPYPRGTPLVKNVPHVIRNGDALVFCTWSSRDGGFDEMDPHRPRPGHELVFRTVHSTPM